MSLSSRCCLSHTACCLLLSLLLICQLPLRTCPFALRIRPSIPLPIHSTLCLTIPGPAECAKRLQHKSKKMKTKKFAGPPAHRRVRSSVGCVSKFPDRAKWAPQGRRRRNSVASGRPYLTSNSGRVMAPCDLRGILTTHLRSPLKMQRFEPSIDLDLANCLFEKACQLNNYFF